MITVTLCGHLWRITEGKRRVHTLPFEEGRSVLEILKGIGIPADSVMIVSVNGERRAPDAPLRDGDSVEVLPVIDGG